MLLYDITSRDSFTSVVGWMESVEEHANSDICIAIVGHKVDLEEERVISTEEGRKVCDGVGGISVQGRVGGHVVRGTQLFLLRVHISLCSWLKTTTVYFLKPAPSQASTAVRSVPYMKPWGQG